MIRDLDLPLSAFHFPREKNGQGILSTGLDGNYKMGKSLRSQGEAHALSAQVRKRRSLQGARSVFIGSIPVWYRGLSWRATQPNSSDERQPAGALNAGYEWFGLVAFPAPWTIYPVSKYALGLKRENQVTLSFPPLTRRLFWREGRAADWYI